jgi:EAL domain-containing protein (putative c-di-GMP-specific phosphodiesterase class I)
VAARCGLQWEFDGACLRTALNGAIGLDPKALLFLNVLPSTFFDASFISHDLPELCRQAGVQPEQVVLEVTEHFAITDLDRFRGALDLARRSGFRIALDDVGSAQANLQQIQALRPDLLKLDYSIVNGLAGVPERCELIGSLVRVGHSFGAVCIAEGVEQEADLEALKTVGVQYVQGFYLGRPAPKPERFTAKS